MTFSLFYAQTIFSNTSFNQENTYDLRFVTHETAIERIKLALAESKKIKLYVGHARNTRRV